MADPYGGWGSPSFGYTTPARTRILRRQQRYGKARGQLEYYGEQFGGYLEVTDVDFPGSHYDLTPNWRIWPIEYEGLMERNPYLYPMNIAIEQYPGVETDIEWLIDRRIPAFSDAGFGLWFLGASIEGFIWLLGSGKYIPGLGNVLRLSYKAVKYAGTGIYIVSRDPISRNIISKGMMRFLRPYYTLFKSLGIDRAIRFLESRPQAYRLRAGTRKGSYMKHVDTRAIGMKSWTKAAQKAQVPVIARKAQIGNKKTAGTWFDEMQEVFEGYPTSVKVAGKDVTVPKVLRPVSPVVKSVEDTVTAGKLFNRTDFISDVFATVQNGLREMPQQLLERTREDLQDKIGDEFKENNMPYIRKWVPFIRRRRRYGRGYRGRRYGRSSYGYTGRRRSYRRY
tara:strand:+ start:458 stop:1639 length:1182 start_codon:yes stop_codon:yes gene_type:complete